MDTGGGDALSISTIGNSTMARSDLAAAGEDGRQEAIENFRSRAAGRRLRENGVDGGNDGGGNGTANQADPHRDARMRWIRINQRFQLMISFVAILFR